MSSSSDVVAAIDIVRKRELRQRGRIYREQFRNIIATSRFTDGTWEENCRMREKNPNIKCVYSSATEMSSRIPVDANVFVIEMNNTTNKIIGIGLIRNHPIAGKYTVYSYNHWNRFTYFGKWRIDCKYMTECELQIIRLLEAFCFKGATHSKRSAGITELPPTLQYLCSLYGLNLPNYITNMFKKRMSLCT